MVRWIDTHCHLAEDAFSPDLAATIQRAVDAGVTRMIVIGCSVESSRAAVELAGKYEPLFASVGIHPNYVVDAGPDDFDEIVRLSHSPKVVAIGETGLDRYWDQSPLDLQIAYFERHLELSRTSGLPFVVHCRDAGAEVLGVLQRATGPLSGVMHSFAGDEDLARECLSLGLHLSIAGMLTFKRNDQLRAVAKTIPLDRLLVETDSPYLAPAPHRGIRNEPSFVIHTAAMLAELRGISSEDLAAATTHNAERLFQLPAVACTGV